MRSIILGAVFFALVLPGLAQDRQQSQRPSQRFSGTIDIGAADAIGSALVDVYGKIDAQAPFSVETKMNGEVGTGGGGSVGWDIHFDFKRKCSVRFRFFRKGADQGTSAAKTINLFIDNSPSPRERIVYRDFAGNSFTGIGKKFRVSGGGNEYQILWEAIVEE